MFFAIIDYVKYKRNWGRYSRASIERQAGRFAEPGLAVLLKDAKPGDELLYHGSNSILSWGVMYFTNSIWSHVAVFGKNGFLYDQTTSGLIKHHFSNYLDGNGFVTLLRPKDFSEEQAEKAMSWAENQLEKGCAFNWPGVFWFGFHILIGNHPNYHIRLSLDFLTFCGIGFALCWNHPERYVFAVIALLYCGVITVNWRRRIAMAKSMFSESPT